MLSLKPLQIFDLMTFKLSAPLTVHEIFLSSLILIGNGKVDMSFFSPQNSDFNFRILEKKKQKKDVCEGSQSSGSWLSKELERK